MWKNRLPLIVALVLLVPVGLATKMYSGPAAPWVNGYLGGALYVVFFTWAFGFLFWKADAWRIAFWVFVATCGVEFLQLWHPPWLEAWRAHWSGRLLLGSTFVWLDFPHYLLGMLIGGCSLRKLRTPSAG